MLLKIAFGLLILFSANARGAGDPFPHYVLRAFGHRDASALTKLLEHPPGPNALEHADGALLFNAYQWLIDCGEPQFKETLKLLNRALALGADPQAPFWSDNGEVRVPVIAAIITNWATHAQLLPQQTAQLNLRSTIFMDALIASGKLDPNSWVKVPWHGTTEALVPLAQYSLLTGGHDAIYAYFLSMHAGIDSSPALLMNAPMILAMYGRLGLLTKYVDVVGLKRAAADFNFHENKPEKHTVMHYALLAIQLAGSSVADVEEMLDFLSRHGANPSDHQSKNSLSVFADEMARRYPARRRAYLELSDNLVASLPALEAKYFSAKNAGCGRALSKHKRLN